MITTHVIKTGEALNSALKAHDNVVVDFFKSGCAPCKMVSLLLKELEKPAHDITQDIHVLKVQLEDVGPDVFAEHGIRSTPTLVFCHKGKVVRTNPGLMVVPKFIGAIKEHF